VPVISAQAVCDAFGLGAPTGVLVRVPGGRSHRLWRLDSTHGRFAVKELNRKWNNPNYVAWYERAFRVELAAERAGVRLPRPVPVRDTRACLAELPDGAERPATVRVHEWVDGTALRPEDVHDAAALQAGAILARIHGLGLRAEQPLEEILTVWGRDHWYMLLDRAGAAGASYSERLRAELPTVADLERLIIAARQDSAPVLLSHCDLDPANVLTDDQGQLVLLDWDGASPCGTMHEVASVALDWAGVQTRDAIPAFVRAVIRGYRDAGGRFEAHGPTVFAYFLRGCLNWLEYSVRRSLGENLQDPDDRPVAEGEVVRVLENLPRFAGSVDGWLRLLA
jgi:Ser/Thr protein kinase RdoA (MazF antagonist)